MESIRRNFEIAYSKLRNEIFAAMESDQAAESTIPDRGDEIPLGFAKEIISEYDKEQEGQQEELSGIVNEFDNNKLTFLLKTLKDKYVDIIEEAHFCLTEHDPIFCRLDAYSPIAWSLEEVPHTKMLSFFLDPRREHNLGTLPLGFFLAALSASGKKLSLSTYADILVNCVEAEKWIKTRSGVDKRLDMYIEMSKPECRILIEGKIKSGESLNQLKDYQEWFSPKPNDVKIYLTPEGDNPSIQGWYPLDWKHVAASFCALLHIDYNETAPKLKKDGLELLRLWTSTLLHHVCRIPSIEGNFKDLMLSEMVNYSSHLLLVKDICDEYRGESDENQ